MKVECHCSNVIIEVDKPKQVTECNCSICSSYMSLWGYYPLDESKVSIGSYGTDSYSWGDHELDFIRCKKCGCVTHYRTKEGQTDPQLAVNFSLVRNIIMDVPVRYFDGASKL
ncbi:MAG: hypothetical protein ACI9ES_002837 [Oceanospirillaceae bacterium]|jgi:hypothetical protein